jgi:2,4-diaminopentanoate dehydrogenase
MTDSTYSDPVAVDGTWMLTIKSPTGPIETILVIARSEVGFTGTQSGQGVSSPISDVKLEGNKLAWTNYVTKPMKMKLECAGVIDGKNISGKVKAGFMGSYPFSGSRQ